MSVKEKSTRVFILSMVIAFVLSSLGFSALVIWSLTHDDSQQNSQTSDVQKQLEDQLKQQQAKLQTTDIKPGKGAAAKKGDEVTVNYTGTLTNGKKFDSSYDRNKPFSFIIGEGQVIKGWDQGLIGMKVGGERKLVIPPALGYGSQSTPDIPANSTLVFDIKLEKIQ